MCAGEFGVMRIVAGGGGREGIFHAYSGSEDGGKPGMCVLGIGKGTLKSKRRRNWLGLIRGSSPSMLHPPGSCSQFRLLSVEESGIWRLGWGLV